jgi:hypothetical protein
VDYQQFLHQVIEGGILGAEKDYTGEKLEGAKAGFELCRLMHPATLGLVLTAAEQDAQRARDENPNHYWYWRCRAAEVEWVCNVVSAMLFNQGLPTIIPPTARAVMRASEILGVASE